MDVVLLLADAAQLDPSGAKVHALGLGWDMTGSPTAPGAVVAFVKVPWTETNRSHHLSVLLRDADGHPIVLPGPVGEQSIQMEGDFEVGRPPGIASGTSQMVKLAINYGPLPLQPGRYEWHASVDGQTQETWTAPFTVAGQQQQSQPQPPG